MLISRGLRAMLWGTTVLATTAPLDASPPRIPRPGSTQARLDIFNPIALAKFVDSYRANHVLPPSIPARGSKASLHSEREGWEDGLLVSELRRRQGACPATDSVCGGGGEAEPLTCPGCTSCCPDGLGGFQCCQAGFRCCISADGVGSCCPADDGACDERGCSLRPRTVAGRVTSTVFATTTVIRTVTRAPVTQTAVVVSTVAETLTFLNPELGTQTNIVTVTAARRRARRHDISVPETCLGGEPSLIIRAAPPVPTITLYPAAAYDALETQLVNLGVNVKRQAADVGVVTVTVTATRTIEITTTITVTGTATITSTIFNTVFVTETVAPSATVTVTSTRTLPSGVATGIPGGGVPPNPGNSGTARNPGILPSGSPGSNPSGTLLPPDGGSNPTNIASGTNLPPGVLPSGTFNPTQTGNPASMGPSPSSTSTRAPTPPTSPFPGAALSSDQIAGIALGVIFGLFFIILAAFLIRRWTKKQQRKRLAREHEKMASGASGAVGGGMAAVAAGGRSGSTQGRTKVGGPSDSSSGGPPGDGEVRIVIRPAPKRRTQSSGLFPLQGVGPSSEYARSQWPRPPGYSGQTYSFFIEESGDTTPQDPNQWSVASEFGSASASAQGTSAPYTASNAPGNNNNSIYNAYSYSNYSQDDQHYSQNFSRNDRRGPGNGGGNRGGNRNGGNNGGGEYLNVGRAMSPWNAI